MFITGSSSNGSSSGSSSGGGDSSGGGGGGRATSTLHLITRAWQTRGRRTRRGRKGKYRVRGEKWLERESNSGERECTREDEERERGERKSAIKGANREGE